MAFLDLDILLLPIMLCKIFTISIYFISLICPIFQLQLEAKVEQCMEEGRIEVQFLHRYPIKYWQSHIMTNNHTIYATIICIPRRPILNHTDCFHDLQTNSHLFHIRRSNMLRETPQSYLDTTDGPKVSFNRAENDRVGYCSWKQPSS